MVGTRWQRVQSYATIAAWYNAAILDDDEFTFEDVDETVKAGIWLGLIWSPQIAMAIPAAAALTMPLAVLEGAALGGLGVSYAIGGEEGAVSYIDYISNPHKIHKDPEKIEALMQAQRIVQGIITLGGSELARAGLDIIGEYKEELFKNRWVTGPRLPF